MTTHCQQPHDPATMPCTSIRRLVTRILALSCMVSLCALPAAAATNVSGLLSANTTWDLAGSPYTLVGTVTVDNAYTLTVASGVQVNMQTYDIYVDEGFNANGAHFVKARAHDHALGGNHHKLIVIIHGL